MKCYYNAVVVCLAILFAADAALAYSNGATFEGVSGAPGDSTCASCHGNLNTGVGSITITAPAGYDPGDTLDITVTVEHVGQARWGFELTVLDGSNQPAGEIVVTDAVRTMIATAVSGREYIKQTLDGSDDAVPNSTDWSFKWLAPPTDIGQVTFYTAGVAGNQGSGKNGDYTYTTSHAMLVTSVHEVNHGTLPESFFVRQNYPNPFNPSTRIEFGLAVKSDVEVAVYNVLGQRVKVLHEGVLPAGRFEAEWDGTDATGNSVSSGAYFCRLQTDNQSAVRKMVLLK